MYTGKKCSKLKRVYMFIKETRVSDMISNSEQRCPVKTSFMQITTFKASKTNFMLFTELNSTMTETVKKSKWWKI